jgi:uncharacterized iron-regulated protein
MKLKQVFPDKLVFEVENETIEISMEDVVRQIRAYVEIVGENPDDTQIKKIVRKLAKDICERRRIVVSKPDFSKLINVELEEGAE